MVREQFQIEPVVLRWARERAGLSIDQLVEDFRDAEKWEVGNGGPTYSQLERLANKLRVPVAVFFFPAPPPTPPIEETFRTLPEAELNRLPSKMRLLLRKAKAFQLNVAELCNGSNPAERLISRDLRFSTGIAVPHLANQVREYLAITVEQQILWNSDDIALRNWRDSLEDVGIFVFKDAFQEPNFSGFCLTDPEFPIIYVNNSSAKTRQIFTLFHELAHLLFETSGIDSIDEIRTRSEGAERIEVICNAFAAEFLLPETVFRTARHDLPATVETAEVLASRYHVSREVIFRRFFDAGEITQATYARAARQWADERRGGSGGDYYRTRLAYLGHSYVGLALRAFRQDRITETQLAEYLDMKPRNLSALEERYVSGVAA